MKTGAPWRWLPNDLPPWEAVYQRSQRWLRAGVFEAIAHDLRALLRLAAGRAPEPTAAIFDARTLQSSPESGHRAGYDGHKRKKGGDRLFLRRLPHEAPDGNDTVIALEVDGTPERDELTR